MNARSMLAGVELPGEANETAFKISLSSRSRLTSALSRLITADSSLMTPGHSPGIQPTSVRAAQRSLYSTPTCLLTAVTAAAVAG